VTWSAAFDAPIALPDGRKLETLLDAGARDRAGQAREGLSGAVLIKTPAEADQDTRLIGCVRGSEKID